MLDVEGCGGAGCRGGDGLPVRRVDHVARGEDSGDRRTRGTAVDPHGAVFGQAQLVVHEVGARVVADCDENPGHGQFSRRAVDRVAQQQARDRVTAEDIGDLAVPDELDLLVRERTVLHDLRRAQLVAAVHDVDLRGELRQERRLLHRRVAAPDDGDLLLAEEEAVARRAVRDAVAGEALLARDTDLAGCGARGEDDRLGLVHGAVTQRDLLHVARQVELDDVLVEDLGPELLGLLLHLGHELGAHDAFGEAGEVLDLGGVHELTTGLDGTRDEERGEVRARRIDRGGEARRAGTDDDDLSHCSAFPRLCWLSEAFRDFSCSPNAGHEA